MTPRRQMLVETCGEVDGFPMDSFGTTAALWNLYLDAKMGDLQAHDIAAMMILFKVAQGAHRDSWVDIAGYAACGHE